MFSSEMSSQSMSYSYYTRSTNDATNCIISTSEHSNPTPVNLDPISSLKTKLLARFAEVQNKLLNVKNNIIKNLQEENDRLPKRVSFLGMKVISLESRYNMLDQYGRSNTFEIIIILDSVSQRDLENKFVDIPNAIRVNISNDDFEDYHRIGKSRNNSKKTVARFNNRKVVQDALYNRQKLKTIDKATLEMGKAMHFLNGNLSRENNKIAFLCRKLKREGMIVNTYSANGIICLSCKRWIQKVPRISYLFENFPDFLLSLENNENADESSLSNESLQNYYWWLAA